MGLPVSFTKAGFVIPSQARNKIRLKNGQFLKPILIGTEGISDSGKTDWALTAPGVIQMICVDRNFDGVFDNPNIRPERNPNVAIKVVEPPLGHPTIKEGLALMTNYTAYYTEIRDSFYSALADPASTVVVMDGDSDFWEVHILSHFGKNTQIYPQTRYAAPYAEKRAQIAKAHDSGKIVIFTNKVRDEYEPVLKPDGTPEKDSQGEDLRRKTGGKERQGFKDQDYLFNMQIRHLYSPPTTRVINGKTKDVPQQWGLTVLKCKHNMEIVGTELWGDDCTFRGLMELAYPDVPLERWGF